MKQIRPQTKKRVFVVNDQAHLNTRYRKSFIELASSLGFNVKTIGLFDSRAGLLRAILDIVLGGYDIIVSSNLRSNVVVLLLSNVPTLIILNGLGRLRVSGFFRGIILFFMSRRKTTVFAVQNYADFRYFQRYCKAAQLAWVPGSGGVQRQIAEVGATIVQRDEKIKYIVPSLLELYNSCPSIGRLNVVGCSDQSALDRLLVGVDFTNLGYVVQDDIFKSGRFFLQPSGYGEGFPHSLADAIVSGMPILIDNREYLRYGLSRIGSSKQAICKRWSSAIVSAETKERLSVEKINSTLISLLQTIQ